ncbi:hypothetical protein [Microbacterium sp.]|uniref:hypothetical protein n=1 Tax=Microbacterium sp. TaxID=51671 RepID=UPI003A8DEDF4
MISPFLYFADERLSAAELSAACLDGHLVELGEGYVPADAVETTALRAGSIAPLLSDTLAATHLSAAWVHGALPHPPGRHRAHRIVGPRPHHIVNRRVAYHDHPVPPSDVLRIGGVWVTTPGRTLADLVRDPTDAHLHAARLMIATGAAQAALGVSWLEQSGPVHNKRPALALLRAWACDADVGQPEVTR